MNDDMSKKITFISVLFLILFLIYILYQHCIQTSKVIRDTYVNTKVFNFPLKNKKFKLNFNKGLISANIGCNTISGMYEIKDDVLHVGPLSMTRKECTEKEENLDLFVITFLSERPDIYLNNENNLVLKHRSGSFIEFEKK